MIRGLCGFWVALEAAVLLISQEEEEEEEGELGERTSARAGGSFALSVFNSNIKPNYKDFFKNKYVMY